MFGCGLSAAVGCTINIVTRGFTKTDLINLPIIVASACLVGYIAGNLFTYVDDYLIATKENIIEAYGLKAYQPTE